MNELLKNFSILYVEDDEITLELVSSILYENFKKVYIADNGEEGINLYNKHKPDIILTDLLMPVMDGLEMSAQIKEENPEQMIAIFTSFNESEHLYKAINIGIDKYILKPLDSEQLFFTLNSIAKILEYKNQKEELENLIKIQSKILSIGEMLQNISHHWRQPLDLISTLASGIKMGKDFNSLSIEDETEMLDKIIIQTKHLSAIIEDFRSFFKNTSIKKEDFEIDDMITKIKALAEDMIDGENITLISNSTKCILHNSQTHFIQIFLNLINNSKDIFIQKNTEEKRYIFINTKIKDNHLIINLKDNAGGIDDMFLDKIFEPYFTTKHQYTGTGLGLYLSLTILKKYFDGTITCKNETYTYENKEYTGANFKIEIPLEEE